jgi:hypothetical protein
MVTIDKYVMMNWSRVRLLGRTRFILLYGVLLWGGFSAVLSTLFFHLVAGNISTMRFFAIALFVFPAFGVLLGADLWRRGERHAR